jgi:BirA family biotin operon repressor/biotin-[acetyl-CoA-carboxylase] ligase
MVWLDAVDSTNDLAERLLSAALEDDEPSLPDTLFVAGTQLSGHGRGFHTWVSPPGGLYATWLAELGAESLPGLPLAVGVACAEAAESLLPERVVGLKWPNDLLIDGRKLGGVLCHARGSGERVWVRVGVGINIAVTPVLDSDDPVQPTSLHDLGWSGDVGAAIQVLATQFLLRVREALADPVRTRGRWQIRLVHRPGDAIRLRLDDGVIEGRFVALSPEGHLLLDVDGEVRSIASGELLMQRDA